MHFKCKFCSDLFTFTNQEFEEEGEEILWGHLQMEHTIIFEDIQNLDTPEMIEACYEIEED